jgi:hypothetical protein
MLSHPEGLRPYAELRCGYPGGGGFGERLILGLGT